MQVTQAQINQQTSSSSNTSHFKENWRIYMRIIKLLRPHWVQAVGTVVCLILATGFSLVVPSLLEWVVDVGIHSGRFQDLIWAALAILGTSALRGLFAYGQGYLSQGISSLVAYDLRNMLYDHLQQLSFSFHDDSETGQLMSRMTGDIEAVRNFFPMGLTRALLAIVTFVPILILLFQLDVYLSLITFILYSNSAATFFDSTEAFSPTNVGFTKWCW